MYKYFRVVVFVCILVFAFTGISVECGFSVQ